MATDWIKMRTDLYRDPKVSMIADWLLCEESGLSSHIKSVTGRDSNVTRNVMRNAVVGALVSVWGVARHRGKRVVNDLVLRGATMNSVDDIADIEDFALAMQSVGWLIETSEDIVLPRFFEEFNVEPSADGKAANAERQRRHRDKLREESNALRNVTVTSQSNAREEKSREEKSREEEGNTGAKVCETQTDLPADGKPKSDDEETKPTPRFVPPTLDEIEAYCRERGGKIDPERFHDFYQSKNWMVGKNKMRDWKAAVRNWERDSGRQPAGMLYDRNDPLRSLREYAASGGGP